MALADKANAFVDEIKPWVMAKDPVQNELLHQVCTTSLNLFRLLTIYLKPILPKIAEDVATFLNIPPLTWADAGKRCSPITPSTRTSIWPRAWTRRAFPRCSMNPRRT